MAAPAMIVATLVKILPIDAKNTSRLMGLWNSFELRNVTAIKAHPARERVEQILSTVVKSVKLFGVRS